MFATVLRLQNWGWFYHRSDNIQSLEVWVDINYEVMIVYKDIVEVLCPWFGVWLIIMF